MGKIRHLDCTDLWIQEKIRSGQVHLEKVLGSANPADAFTKYVDKQILDRAMDQIGMVKLDGRARCAPQALGLASKQQ